jgi:hypothetical protein
MCGVIMATTVEKSSKLEQLNVCIAFLDEQITFHKARCNEFIGIPKRAFKHQQTFKANEAVKELLLALYNKAEDTGKPIVVNKEPRYSLSMKELENLPKELLDELSIKTDSTEFAIIEIIETLGGAASLDQIIVHLYRKTGEILKRSPLTNRLYRMSQKEQVYSVPGKKGVYSVHPQEGGENLDEAPDDEEDGKP